MAQVGYTNPHENWIPDQNRFALEQPPDWFLSGLHGYDPQLVLLPSRFNRAYLLARRRQYTVGLGDVAMLDNTHPDTLMCYTHGVLPIAPLRWQKTGHVAFTQANLDSLLTTLRERDTWAHGGGPLAHDPDAVADAVDAFDAEQERKTRRATWQDFYYRGLDAARSLHARLGSRNKRASDYHGVARASQPAVPLSGQRVTLTDAH